MKRPKKKTILLLLCSIIAFISLKAQTVFAPPNSVWHFEYYKDFGDASSNYLRYETVKDTMYFGKLCSKIVGRNIKVNYKGVIIDTSMESPIFTYVNGDSVFYYNDVFNQFYPLYIFNVKVGDTVTYHVPYIPLSSTDTVFSVIIDSIKHISIDGIDSRIIWSSTTSRSVFDMGILIERLGTINRPPSKSGPYFIGHSYGVVPASGAGWLRCYQDGLIDTNLSSSGFSCEYMPTRIDDIKLNSAFSIYPNPASDKVSITLPNQQKIEQISIYSIEGKLVQAWTSSPVSHSIDISNLANGLYYVRLSIEGNSYNQKLIIQH